MATVLIQKIKMAEKSKILIIGGTGKLGQYMVKASATLGHYTLVLVRRHTIETDPLKAKFLSELRSFSTVKIIYGDLNDHGYLVKALKEVDVAISCIGGQQVPEQVKIIEAIKEAGNIKRYFPSEYAIDVDRVHSIEPAASLFAGKKNIRRLLEIECIPHTIVVAYGFASHFIPNLAQMDGVLPNINRVIVYGDGNSKIICTKEEDIAKLTIKTVNDPRTMNKILYIRPPENIISFNELFDLYEKKTGNTLERRYISEEELLELVQSSGFPANILLAVCYSVSIKNDYANFEIQPSFGVDSAELYPDEKCTTIDEYLDEFI